MGVCLQVSQPHHTLPRALSACGIAGCLDDSRVGTLSLGVELWKGFPLWGKGAGQDQGGGMAVQLRIQLALLEPAWKGMETAAWRKQVMMGEEEGSKS